MRHEQGRARSFGPDALQLEVEPLTRHLVEGTERLVEQQDLGQHDERTRDRDPLAHAARKLCGPRLFEALEPHEPHERVDGVVSDLHAGQLQGEPDVGDHRPPRQQRRLLERDPEVMIAAGGRGILPVHQRLPTGGRFEIREDPQDRRLAAPRRAEQGGERAHRRCEVDALQRDDFGAPDLEDLAELTQRYPVVGDETGLRHIGVDARQGLEGSHVTQERA